MTAAEILNAVTGSAVIGAAAREVWRWYTARTERAEAAKRAAAAAAESAAARTDAAATTREATVAELLREQIAAGEARAEKSAERAVVVAAALNASATAIGDVRAAIDRVPPAITAEADRAQTRLERIELLLTEIRAHVAPQTSEHRAGVS